MEHLQVAPEIAEIVPLEIETTLESAIEDALQEAVQDAIADVSLEGDLAYDRAELAVEIAIQAADDAVVGDAILAEEFRAWQVQCGDLQASQSAEISAMQATLATISATLATTQNSLADYQAALLISQQSEKTSSIMETSIQKPHTDEKLTEHLENVEGDSPAPKEVKKSAAAAKRKRVFWG